MVMSASDIFSLVFLRNVQLLVICFYSSYIYGVYSVECIMQNLFRQMFIKILFSANALLRVAFIPQHLERYFVLN